MFGCRRYVYLRKGAAYTGRDVRMLALPAIGEWFRGASHNVKTQVPYDVYLILSMQSCGLL